MTDLLQVRVTIRKIVPDFLPTLIKRTGEINKKCFNKGPREGNDFFVNLIYILRSLSENTSTFIKHGKSDEQI